MAHMENVESNGYAIDTSAARQLDSGTGSTSEDHESHQIVNNHDSDDAVNNNVDVEASNTRRRKVDIDVDANDPTAKNEQPPVKRHKNSYHVDYHGQQSFKPVASMVNSSSTSTTVSSLVSPSVISAVIVGLGVLAVLFKCRCRRLYSGAAGGQSCSDSSHLLQPTKTKKKKKPAATRRKPVQSTSNRVSHFSGTTAASQDEAASSRSPTMDIEEVDDVKIEKSVPIDDKHIDGCRENASTTTSTTCDHHLDISTNTVEEIPSSNSAIEAVPSTVAPGQKTLGFHADASHSCNASTISTSFRESQNFSAVGDLDDDHDGGDWQVVPSRHQRAASERKNTNESIIHPTASSPRRGSTIKQSHRTDLKNSETRSHRFQHRDSTGGPHSKQDAVYCSSPKPFKGGPRSQRSRGSSNMIKQQPLQTLSSHPSNPVPNGIIRHNSGTGISQSQHSVMKKNGGGHYHHSRNRWQPSMPSRRDSPGSRPEGLKQLNSGEYPSMVTMRPSTTNNREPSSSPRHHTETIILTQASQSKENLLNGEYRIESRNDSSLVVDGMEEKLPTLLNKSPIDKYEKSNSQCGLAVNDLTLPAHCADACEPISLGCPSVSSEENGAASSTTSVLPLSVGGEASVVSVGYTGRWCDMTDSDLSDTEGVTQESGENGCGNEEGATKIDGDDGEGHRLDDVSNYQNGCQQQQNHRHRPSMSGQQQGLQQQYSQHHERDRTTSELDGVGNWRDGDWRQATQQQQGRGRGVPPNSQYSGHSYRNVHNNQQQRHSNAFNIRSDPYLNEAPMLNHHSNNPHYGKRPMFANNKENLHSVGRGRHHRIVSDSCCPVRGSADNRTSSLASSSSSSYQHQQTYNNRRRNTNLTSTTPTSPSQCSSSNDSHQFGDYDNNKVQLAQRQQHPNHRHQYSDNQYSDYKNTHNYQQRPLHRHSHHRASNISPTLSMSTESPYFFSQPASSIQGSPASVVPSSPVETRVDAYPSTEMTTTVREAAANDRHDHDHCTPSYSDDCDDDFMEGRRANSCTPGSVQPLSSGIEDNETHQDRCDDEDDHGWHEVCHKKRIRNEPQKSVIEVNVPS